MYQILFSGICAFSIMKSMEMKKQGSRCPILSSEVRLHWFSKPLLNFKNRIAGKNEIISYYYCY